MKEEQVSQRWRELFEELAGGTDLDSQALFEQALPCFYKIYPSKLMDDIVPPGESHTGGLPDLPAGIPWPVHEGQAMSFLAQVNLKELVPGFAPYIPPRGWLYFFLQEKDIWGDTPHRVVYFDGPASDLQRITPPDSVSAPEQSYPPRALRFETGFTLHGELMDGLLSRYSDWKSKSGMLEALVDHFQRECTRVGGHPMSFQSLSEQSAYLKLSGLDVLYTFGTSLYSLENLIRRERLEQEDPERVVYLRTEVARQIEEYHRDFAVHKQRMRSICPIFVLGSDDEMLWGDGGFLQFFIHETDLAQRDFSRTYCEVIST